ncbi:S8 family serine peptidase [Abyssisolibacter fermentans]|uniref:S8 family serine peptidase n=1 Tax=Abyssisolibacter fermentans TaxID=1766203 RepID=UPI0008355EF5|nr:S8 family serine peptidase [Abyssisolibacter fermentans]
MNKKFKRNISLFLVAMMMMLCVAPITSYADETKGSANGIYLKGMNEKIPNGLLKKGYSQNEIGPYMVNFNGPIKNEMKSGVESLGAELVEYIPDFAFLTTMTPEVAEKVKELSFVEEVMVYQPAFKIHPSLKDDSGNVKDNGEVALTILTFDDESVLDEEIAKSNGKKLGHAKNKVKVKMESKHIEKFANLNNVKYIEPVVEYVLFNDEARVIMNVDEVWNLGYDGSGQVVCVCDTGIDKGINDSSMHSDFQGKIDAIHALGRSTADDPHGHGTHVAGSVLGNGTRSNGQLKGVAPDAHLVFQSVLDSNGGLGGLPNDLNDLFAQAWNDGARIHTNSWGAASNGDYNIDAQNVDEYVWNNDMTILFAAGNEGYDKNTGNILYNSIGTPGSAKNCITVGATENNRPNMYDTYMGNLGDNINEVVAFSSRGNCEDGRIKPDIVAPGSWILSTKSSVAPVDNYWDAYNDYYAYMGGTSMATPLTAGAVAVAREYMQQEWNHTPSPAMMKAAIINGGTDMSYGYPSRDQGWGRLSLADSLVSKEYRYEDETYSLNTGENQSFTYSVESSNTPLKISLVWTDFPGSTSASKALVNDIDLKVTSPSGTIYYGNDFTAPYNSGYDRLNNVENVYIDTPETGNYTVEINGYNIPQGSQPFALFSSGDFGTPSDDTIAPTCDLTSPANGETVNETVILSADASDNEGISRVEFYVDDNKVGTDVSSPYSINWDSTTVSNGSHTILAKAFDIAGNIDTSTITVNVENEIVVSYVTDTFSERLRKSTSIDYNIDVTAAGTIDLNLTGSGFTMSLYNPSGNEVASGTSSVSYNATDVGSYRIRVTNTNTKRATFTLTATYPVIQ